MDASAAGDDHRWPAAMSERIRLLREDITRLAVDAIVNAANPTLLGGGGVDGAIHRAAGPELLAECRTLGGCAPGDAKITRGYRLPAAWIIHAVGPVWQGGHRGEDETLAACYRTVLGLARARGVATLAIPAISCGVYGFPIPRACRIALREIRLGLAAAALPARIDLVCFDASVHAEYARRLDMV
jgi:O-acetyl-ADP-ribose deacetylase (regulator of RNase III)